MKFVLNVLGVHYTMIKEMVSRFRETGLHYRHRGQGRKRVKIAREDRYLRMKAFRNKGSTSIELRNDHSTSRNVLISAVTVRRYLHKTGLSPHRCTRMSTKCNDYDSLRTIPTGPLGNSVVN